MTQQTVFQHEMPGQPSNVMSPQQAAALLEGAAVGDTDMEALTAATLDSGAPSAAPAAAPAVAVDPAASPAAAPAAAPAGTTTQPTALEDPANTVVLAKDGVHTIGYEKLVEARTAAATNRAAADAANAALAEAQTELNRLKAEAAARASAGVAPTAADTNVAAAQAAMDLGVSPEVFGDWSPEAMAKGVQTVLQHGTKQLVEQMATMHAQLQELRGTSAKTAQQQHYDAIYNAHADADSIAESAELQAWINSKPAFVRPAYQEVLAKGSQQEVIDFFTAFKKETGSQTAAAPAAAPAAQAAALQAANSAIQQASSAVPTSLSDIPGVRGAGSVFDQLDAMAESSPAQLLEALSQLPEQQRLDYINRNS